MTKALRLVVVVVALVAFGLATVSMAAEFYVVKGKDGKLAVVDKKPDDAKSVVKGPFADKAAADKALAEASKAAGAAKKPIKPPSEGC